MKFPRNIIAGFALAAVTGCFLPSVASAELVSHHSLTVDADAPALTCIGCHDGTMGPAVTFCTVRCDFKSEHVILKHYPPHGKETLYAPTAVIVAKGIRLEKGKVTCRSCHNLRNSAKNHLVMSNAGSQLCRVCHIRE